MRAAAVADGDAEGTGSGAASLTRTRAAQWTHAAPTWLPWLLLRMASGAVAILSLSVLVFAATQALPSDPARVILGPDAPEESIRTLRHQIGMDRPVTEQYFRWVRRAAVGDFGRSLDSDVPVSEIVVQHLENTFALLIGETALAVPGALVLGVFLALRRDGALDRSVVYLLVLLKAVPIFAVAIGLVMLLATSIFKVFPAVSLVDPNVPLLGQLHYLVLPVLTLAVSSAPYLVRLVRTAMIDVLESDYVAQARLRGIPERRILWRHALPNALVPAIQGTALMLSVSVAGSLVVEVMFAFPGIGSALNAAVGVRDLPVIQAIVLVIAVLVVAINLAADLLTVLLTPRLRTAGGPPLLSRSPLQAATGDDPADGWDPPL
jgi:peptide/nickel transport system permease protein